MFEKYKLSIMKSLKVLSVFFLSVVILSFNSCDNEPLEGDFGSNNNNAELELNCADATQNLALATTNYSQVTSGDSNYNAVCTAYANALQDQITACGDDTGALQLLLDSLDCLPNNEFTLCDGNGSDIYFPLAIGNYWKWVDPFPINSTPDVTAEIIGMFEHDGVEYYELEYTGSDGAYHFKYLRYDSNNNLKVLVYYIDNVNGNYYQEHMLIPNSPLSSSSEWDFYGAFDQDTANFHYIQDVYNVNLTVETDSCEYDGCLEIFTKNTLADPAFPQFVISDYKVYKKGVGIVNFNGNKLTEMILN